MWWTMCIELRCSSENNIGVWLLGVSEVKRNRMANQNRTHISQMTTTEWCHCTEFQWREHRSSMHIVHFVCVSPQSICCSFNFVCSSLSANEFCDLNVVYYTYIYCQCTNVRESIGCCVQGMYTKPCMINPRSFLFLTNFANITRKPEFTTIAFVM